MTALRGLRRRGSLRWELAHRPYYVHRPSQALRRLAGRPLGRPAGDGLELGELPWGLPLAYDMDEMIGASISRTGVFEVVVTELLHRLSAPGELALDVGANIGYMTSVLAAGVIPAGRVIAIEPHPVIAARLRENVARWTGAVRVEVLQAAASNRDGVGQLNVDEGFGRNAGTASLDAGASAAARHAVELVRLDDVVPEDAAVGVLKLDVEGHEAAVLDGAAALLARGAIRDVVFEAHDGHPSPVTEKLASAGFTILEPRARIRGVQLLPVGSRSLDAGWDTPNLLATTDPRRALDRFARRGWWSLRASRRVQPVGPAA